MKIKSIHLVNFRQFRDFKVEFDLTNPEQNVTVIRAKNSTGKTTFMQSIKWCLFGEAHVDLQSVVPAKLINMDEVEHCRSKFEDEMEFSVSLEVLHEEQLIKITRKQTIHAQSLNRKEQFLLYEYQDDGETKVIRANDKQPEKTQNIERKINRIISSQMANYFLFDGERIQKLAESAVASKNEISNAIEAVSSLPMLNNAISTLRSLMKVVRKEESQAINNSEVTELENNMSVTEKEISKLQKDINKHENDLENVKIDFNSIDKELDRHKNISTQQGKRKELERRIQNCKQESTKLFRSITEKFTEYQFARRIIMLNQKYKAIDFNLEQATQTIPHMSTKAIDAIIEREICICGHEIDQNSKEKLLEQRNYQPPKSPEAMLSGYEMNVKDEVGKINNLVETIKENINAYLNLLDQLKLDEEALQEINSSLNSSDEEKIIKLNKQRENANNEKARLNQMIGSLKTQLKSLESEYKKDTTKFNNLKSELLKSEIIQYRSEILNRSIDKLTLRQDRDRKELREKIEYFANKHFSKIISKDKIIKIDDTFQHRVFEPNGDIAAPSSGEFVAVSFSIILAIIDVHHLKINSKNEDYDITTDNDFFLVMDGPFATLDQDYASSISEKLVKSVEQIILLTNDIQYSQSVKTNIRPKVSKEYLLDLPEERKNSLKTEYLVEVNINEK